MTPRQRLELRASEISQRQSQLRPELQRLGALDSPSAEERSLMTDHLAEMGRLDTELADLEPRIRAARYGEAADPDFADLPAGPEHREFDRLIARARSEYGLGRIIQHRLGGSELEGATLELCQAIGAEDNQIPTALLAARERAAASVTAPTNVGVEARPLIAPVFPMPVADFLGVMPISVPAGEQAVNVVADLDPIDATAEGTGAGNQAITFSSSLGEPESYRASGTLNRGDIASLATLDAGIRDTLNSLVAAGIEKDVVTDLIGTGPTAPDSAEITFATAKSKLYGLVDGKYAGRASDVRLVVGSATLAKLAGLYRTTNGADTSNALEELERISGGVMVSANVPAAATSGARDKTQEAVAARGMDGARLFVWDQSTLIVDPYSLASDSQIKLTVVTVADFMIARRSNFPQLNFKLSA
ncbi:MAG: hypothetical protein F4X02_12565 [Chloroflexi bacterium]|nr:hypothetical protein [Chloroflexota bacterium]